VLIALSISDHVHHDRAGRWFAASDDEYATCPITQEALVRLVLRHGGMASDAMALLRDLTAHSRHSFWTDAVGFEQVSLAGVLGHRQVSDAYLAGLARHHAGTVATFDAGFAALHRDVVVLI
jgi:toxin-antitoxin system PIN domain toxin